jgi:hypothetical protein
MPIDLAGNAVVGIAFETTAGTYVAPTKFFPVRSESLRWVQETNWRRVIRGLMDPLSGIAGNGHVEGDIEMEVLSDVLPYFLHASRNTVVKTGAAPYTYTTTPKHTALPTTARTLSITVERAGAVFGYVGCVVGSMNFGQDNALGTVTFSILGTAEASQAAPTEVYSNQTPFGAAQWSVQVPTASQVFDVDNFQFQIEDNAAAENRLKTVMGAQFVRFGERTVTVSLDRDFADRVEYDIFKALTARSITVSMTKGAGESVALKAPAAIIDTYEANAGSVGDLLRASVSYMGTYDSGTSKAYEIVVVTPTENIT